MQFLVSHLFKYLSRLSALLVFCFVFFSAKAQNSQDSIVADSAFLSEFDEFTFLRDTVKLKEPASYVLFQRYQPQYSGFPFFRVGNIGHAMYSPMLSYLTQPTSLQSSIHHPYIPYFDQRDNINYYRNKPPFTVLAYSSGAKKEEAIDVGHARNFGDNFNMALHLKKDASDGFYNNLAVRSTHFNLNINYSTANHRYMLLSHYYVNRKELEENGGFDDFESTENPETLQSSRLDYASNDARDEGFLLSQNIGFGNTAKKNKTLIKPLFRIGHDLSYSTGYKKYEDLGRADGLNTDFYDNIYYDSTLTRDRLAYEKLSNQVNVYLYPGKERIKFYYLNDFINYRQNESVDTVYTDHISGTEFSLYMFKKSYRTDIKASYVFEGFRKGDLKLLLDFQKIKQDTANKPYVLSHFYYDLSNPMYKQLVYNSNNFIWNNDFNKTQRWGVKFGLGWKGYQLSADGGFISNHIYYDLNSLPDQLNNRVSFLSLGLNKLLNWKNIHLDNRLAYQNTSNDALPVSTFMVNESIYFQNYMFKKVVQFRLGFDVFYFTGYKALDYMPVTGEFHLQDRQTIGNYPFVDFYMTFRLKRAFFYIKMEHVNKGMSGTNYYNIPDYPVPPRAFKWGIKWTMYD